MQRVALALLLFAVAGCGAQAADVVGRQFRDPDQKAVAEKVEDLETAGKRGQPDDICSDILAKTLVSQLDAGRHDCATEMQKAIDDANEFDLEVQKVTITATRPPPRSSRATTGRPRR